MIVQPDGSTALENAQAIRFVDANGSVIRSVPLPGGADLGPLHRNPRDGHFWFASDGTLYEVDGQGAELWKADISSLPNHEIRVWWRQGGGAYASTGTECAIVEVDALGRTVNTVGGLGGSSTLDFFAGFVRLSNGNFVVANWLAHVSNPPAFMPHLVELTPDGKMVWQYLDRRDHGAFVWARTRLSSSPPSARNRAAAVDLAVSMRASYRSESRWPPT